MTKKWRNVLPCIWALTCATFSTQKEKVSLIISPSGAAVTSASAAEVELVELYAKENASNHRTDRYELVSDQDTPVLRRAQTFYMAVRAKKQQFDLRKDRIKVCFQFGECATYCTTYTQKIE